MNTAADEHWMRQALELAERAQHEDDEIHRLARPAEEMLYLAMGGFVGTSLALACDAFLGFKLGVLPTVLAVVGVVFLLGGCMAMWREVTLAVSSFNHELDSELDRRRS